MMRSKPGFNNFARIEGKTTSELVRELIEEYIRKRYIGAHIEDVWMRTGKRLKAKGITHETINTAIKASRKARR